MSLALRDTFPGVYAGLLPSFFDHPAPEEKKATCADCAMCQPAGAPPAEGVVYFRPDAKCCTFSPRLPNYLAGAILGDPDPAMEEGRRRVRARIAQRVGVSPRWLAPSRKYSILHGAARGSSFGRSLMLRCPYFETEGGLCTIWRHRESDCSTFFCRYEAGAFGLAFWKSLDAYLRRVEGKLAEHAAASVGPSLGEPPGARGELTMEELEDRPPPPAGYAAWWREWEGREEAFYLACHDLVRGLGPADLERLVGGDALADLEAAHRRLTSPALPERLQLNTPAQTLADGVLVASYSRYEPIKLTEGLHEVLAELGPNETVAEVRARLSRDHGVDLPEETVFELYRLGVLVSTGVPTPEAAS